MEAYLNGKLIFWLQIILFGVFAVLFEILVMNVPIRIGRGIIPYTQLAPALAYLLFILIFRKMFVPIIITVEKRTILKSFWAILIPVILAGAAYVAAKVGGIAVGIIGQSLPFITPVVIVSLLVGSITEEIGWRSFYKQRWRKNIQY
jgi:membrane protease YdiL (CAAX protease family)